MTTQTVPKWVTTIHGGEPTDWRQVGGGWAHRTATIHEGAFVGEGAVICSGAVVCSGAVLVAEGTVVSADAVVGEGTLVGADAVVGESAVMTRDNALCLVGVGSSSNTLLVLRRDDGTLDITRGCFRGDLDAFRAAVEEKHGDNEHGVRYRRIIAAIEAWAKSF